MKIYAVGGSVRDELLGLPVTDHDWVVVGATPEEMVRLGFRPVGADFPVFLHPETKEEYALARTERKTAPGYRGFAFHAAPEVTLEEDLRRRDLTINAMARADDGSLVDPYGGEADLKRRVLRHVSSAFAEDPVRILRVARFAARLNFDVADETLALMRDMVAAGEADHLVPERVWQEVSRGLLEAHPARMLQVLADSGALERALPEVAALAEAVGMVNLKARLEAAVAHPLRLAERYTLLTLGMPEASVRELSERVNAPSECRDLACLAAREWQTVDRAVNLDAEGLLALLERCDAFRRPTRLDQLLRVLRCARGTAAAGEAEADPRTRLMAGLAAARTVDAATIAQTSPGHVAAALHAARVARIAQALGG
jgi:tRNA nucleotidyltransferase (CCA-adding enzyme)